MMKKEILKALADPEIVEGVKPLLDAAVDEKIRPIAAKVEELKYALQVVAQEVVRAGGGTPQTNGETETQDQTPSEEPGAPVNPPASMQPSPPVPPPAAEGAGEESALLSLAPLIAQAMGGNQNSNSLSSMVETLSAATQITNAMSAPMWQGMRMVTEMMSLAGRAGIEPSVAADTLGGMIDRQTDPTNGHTPAGPDFQTASGQ